MSDKALPRPRQVTFSGWSIIVGSVLTILFAFQRIADLGSLEAQESAADFISSPPGDGLGLSVDDVQLAIRVMCLIAGGIAAATAILGWQVLQRSRSARVVLSVLAPILFVSGLTSGGLFSALVAAGVTVLWVQPARDWFNGKTPVRDAGAAERVSGASSWPPVVAPPSDASPSGQSTQSGTSGTSGTVPPPPPTGTPWELPHPQQAAGQGATMTEASRQSHDPYGAPVPASAGTMARPRTVTAAVVVAIVASSTAFAGLVASMLYIVSNRAEFLRQINEQLATNAAYEDISADTMADVAVGFLVLLAVWCLIAIGLAIGTLRGSTVARVLLVASASLSALVSLLGALVIVPLVLTIASVATVVLLFTGGAGDWFAARKRTG